ncbi:MAG: phosphopantetheine-binding protein [Paludibacteraceae bacterium]|nr:acyl carrier protein [Candidatus Physcocola equi]MCQ2233908.1 phosphopantetheine-binding protein [Paludibacteraceae bacterium]
MSKEEIIERVVALLSEEFEVEADVITPEANIKKTLELDSLSLVDLVAAIDGEFGIKTNGQEMNQVQTFAELYDFIEKKQA